MPAIYGPYYTLSEAQELLSLRETELLFAVEKGELTPVVITASRPMLVVTRSETGAWTGHATCTYRGPLVMHKQTIKRLLDEERFRLRTSTAIPLEYGDISGWSTDYPFKKQTPHGPIKAWNPRALAELQPYSFGVTPLPREFQPVTNMFGDMLAKMAAVSPEMNEVYRETTLQNGPKPAGLDTLELDFDSRSAFSREDLRIPKSEIDKRLNLTTKASPNSLPAEERENQLHDLIYRVLAANPGIKAKAAWRLIEEDHALESPVYDSDDIIEVIDTDSIQWRSRYGKSQSLAWGSFQTLLPRLRNKMRERGKH